MIFKHTVYILSRARVKININMQWNTLYYETYNIIQNTSYFVP